MSTDAINVENAGYNYGEIQAVKGISFHVGEGEIFGFLGPNGAGKSTTIKMLTGQICPKQGKISVLGLDITKKSGEVQAQIGICFERTNLYEQMSAIQNLKLFAKLFGIKKFDADELITRVGLEAEERTGYQHFQKA